MGEGKVVTLMSFETSTAALNQANVIASMLESMGIDVEVSGDIANTMIPFTGSLVRILINENDLARARELLAAKIEKNEWDDQSEKQES